jgi:hypothetical protein
MIVESPQMIAAFAHMKKAGFQLGEVFRKLTFSRSGGWPLDGFSIAQADAPPGAYLRSLNREPSWFGPQRQRI